MSDTSSIMIISERLFYAQRSTFATVRNAILYLLLSYSIFQLIPFSNPSSAIPEIHFSWTINLFMIARTVVLGIRAKDFLLYPRTSTFYSILPLNYDERVDICQTFFKSYSKETLLFVTTSFILGTIADLFILQQPLLGISTFASLAIIFAPIFLQKMIGLACGRLKRFLSRRDSHKSAQNGNTLFSKLSVKMSLFRISLSERLTCFIQDKTVALAMRHQIHTLLRESKLFLVLVLLIIPIHAAFFLISFPEVFQKWFLTLLLGAFSVTLLGISEPCIHSARMLVKLPFYNVEIEKITDGYRRIVLILFMPTAVVFILAVNHVSLLFFLFQSIIGIIAFAIVLFWSQYRLTVKNENSSLHMLQVPLLFVLLLSLDKAIHLLGAVILW